MRILALLLLGFYSCLIDAAERISIGLTAGGETLDGFVAEAASAEAPVVVLLGALNGEEESAATVTQEFRKYDTVPLGKRRYRLIAIPAANPAKARLAFPPDGAAYRENTESHYLWRWLGAQAPDLVLISGREDFGLAAALSRELVAGIGRIPARTVDARRGLLSTLPKNIPPSEARREAERRVARPPRQVAELLAQHYGQTLDTAVYIPGMALVARLRLGQTEEVASIVAPYFDGSKESLAKPTGSHLAGHLVFAELAERTGDVRYIQRVRAAADLGFTESGQMKESMPLHEEMSDAVFMGCPILAFAGKLTGESRYCEMALRHLRFIQKLCLRPDGLYRHSPLDEVAWGRGNGFPALGLAMTLSNLPSEHPSFDPIRLAFQTHIAALARCQSWDGMWRQVIDRAGAYSEFTATAMIATAMLRGVRRGWLDGGSYQPRVERAWKAVQRRIAEDGTLLDVCESTGKQKSLDDYLRRTALFGRDPRGGAMAMLFAAEMAGLP